MTKQIFTLTLISASALLLGACNLGTVGNTRDIDPATNSDYSITQADEETLGACSVTNKTLIETALGKSVMEPVSTGVQNIMGSKGETCVYAFDEAGVSHSFYVDMEVFPTKAEIDESKEYSGLENMKPVSGLGDEAYFESSELLTGNTEHVLKIYNDTKRYSLVVSHDDEDTSVTSATAEKALLQIAEAAQL